jgi:hypothetical protein
MSRTLMDFASRMPPDIALPVMQTAFEMTDIPNKEKVMEKLAAAVQKQDALTQQKIMSDQIAKEKPPPAPAAAPPETPQPMGPAEPGITAEEVLKKIMAGETWGAINQIKDTTAEKAAEFVKSPKPVPGTVKAGAPTKAKKGG